MNEQALERIDALAAKLGVVGEHLWEVLVRQAYIEGVKAALMVAVVLLLLLPLRRWFDALVKDEYADEVEWVGFSILAIGYGVVLLVVAFYAIDAVGWVLNPEYFALQKVLP